MAHVNSLRIVLNASITIQTPCRKMAFSRSSSNVELFDLLPEEMVIFTLSFVDAGSLLTCRRVCKRWRTLVDVYAFREKASRENEMMNNGRGYYSFSEIDSKTVRKLELPWYVFYAICKYDPFNRNLVKNHCGQNGLDFWIAKNQNHSWNVEKIPVGSSPLPDNPDFEGYKSCFVTSFRLSVKRQEIIFKNYGLTRYVMEYLQPEIVISEWYNSRFDCGCKYTLRAAVYNKKNKLLEQHNYRNTLQPQFENNWIKVLHSFKDQSKAASLILEHTGVDTQFWAGNYGTKISGTVVKVMLPIKLKCANY